MKETIRLLNDGERYYIVIDHPTDETKQAAINFVAERFKLKTEDVKKKEETPEGVLPNTVEDYDVNEKELKEVSTESGKVSEVKMPYISTMEDFNEWFFKIETLKESELVRLKQFYKRRMRGVSKTKIDTVKKYLQDYRVALKEVTDKIIQQDGYANFDDFIEKESDGKVVAAYDLCRNYMSKKLRL